jgi:hypothetical protein
MEEPYRQLGLTSSFTRPERRYFPLQHRFLRAGDDERWVDPKRKWFALHAKWPWGYE